MSRASITVLISRDNIDPQGIGTSSEYAACAQHLIETVRGAYPDADVYAVEHGGRTSGTDATGADITRDVETVLADAWDSWCSWARADWESSTIDPARDVDTGAEEAS